MIGGIQTKKEKQKWGKKNLTEFAKNLGKNLPKIIGNAVTHNDCLMLSKSKYI